MHSKQRIAILEEKVAKEDAQSSDTAAGAANTMSDKLQTLLDTHQANIEQAERDHACTIADFEGQIAELHAKIAVAEKAMAARRAIDERLRFELQEKVTSLQQPAPRMVHLREEEHFARLQTATKQRFSPEWFHANGLAGHFTEKALKLIGF